MIENIDNVIADKSVHDKINQKRTDIQDKTSLKFTILFLDSDVLSFISTN